MSETMRDSMNIVEGAVNKFCITFRLEKKEDESQADYKLRYEPLNDLIKGASDKAIWDETTSLLFFSSVLDINTISKNIKGKIDPKRDQALLIDLSSHKAVHIGQCADKSVLGFYLSQLSFL